LPLSVFSSSGVVILAFLPMGVMHSVSWFEVSAQPRQTAFPPPFSPAILSPSQTLSEVAVETLVVFPSAGRSPQALRLARFVLCFLLLGTAIQSGAMLPSDGEDALSSALRSMPTVNLSDVKPGMILAEAVRNHQDQLLLEAGRRITEKSIRIFKSWGIRRLTVKYGPEIDAPVEEAGLPRPPPDIDVGLKGRFSDAGADPLMDAILQAASRQLASRRAKQKPGYGRR